MCGDLWVSWCCQCHGGDLSFEVSSVPRAFRDVDLLWGSISVACNGGWVFLWVVVGFLVGLWVSPICQVVCGSSKFGFWVTPRKKRLIFQERSPHYMRIPTQTSIFSSLMSLLKDTDTKVQMEVIMDLFSFHSWNSYKNVERYL